MRFLNEREELVLRTIIDEYIDTSEPVGSRNVSKLGPLKMSPATIRNIMSDLVEKGFIAQPHTSAGRIPTDIGYRYYIDRLVSMQSLTPEVVQNIHDEMTFDPVNVMNMFKLLSKKLGHLTNSIGFVVSPKPAAMKVKHIEFVRLNRETMLAVLVTQSGIVQNVILNIEDNIADNDLVHIGNYLNEKFAECTMSSIRDTLAREIAVSEGEIRRTKERAIIIGDAICQSPAFEAEFIFDGTPNIIDMPELREGGKLRDVLKTFEEKRMICSILDKCMEENSVQIFIGSEIGLKDIEELGMVIKPYSRGGNIIGTLGVIGPKRMRYPQVVSIVDYSAQIISRILNDYYGGNDE